MKQTTLLAFLLTVSVLCGNHLSAQNDSVLVLTVEEEIGTITDRIALMPDAIRLNLNLDNAYLTNADDAVHLKRLSPAAFTYLTAATASGDNIQLCDGSLWYVNPSHRDLIRSWISTDPLFIKPIATCWSFYSYVLQNRETKQIVEVTLLKPPLDNGTATRWITYINPIDRVVYLNDNTMWKVSPNDRSFPKWMIGHRLIVGVNNKWRESKYPHILINTGIYKAPYAEAEFFP